MNNINNNKKKSLNSLLKGSSDLLKDSLLEKYLLYERNNNYLAVKLLESTFQINILYQGIHRILLIIKYDLEELVNINKLSNIVDKDILKHLPGIQDSFNNVSLFIEDIINILKDLIDDNNNNNNNNNKCIPIEFKDIEDKLIDSISKNLMGKKNNRIKHTYNQSAKLLKIILIIVFHEYVSPYGLLIHDYIIVDKDIEKGLNKIIGFYIYKSFFKVKSITKLSYISIKIPYISKKFKIETIDINKIINEFVNNINKEIKKYKRCEKTNSNCEKNLSFCNQYSCENKKNIYQKNQKLKKNWTILKINCNNKDVFDKSIIKQAERGSIIAKLIIFSEFYLSNKNKNSIDFLDFFELKGQNNRSLKNLILNYIKHNYLETFDDINNLLIIIYRAGYIKVIDDLMKNWGLISPCTKQPIKRENILPKLNLHNYELDLNASFNANVTNIRGNFNLAVNNYDKNYASFYIKTKTLNKYNFYFSNNLISYWIDEKIEEELKYKIFAILNITYISYSTFIYDETDKTYNIYINDLIKFNNKKYFILIEIPDNDNNKKLISYLHLTDDIHYYVNTDMHNDFMLEYKEILKKHSIYLYLIPIIFINDEIEQIKKIIIKNNRSFIYKEYTKIFNKKENSLYYKQKLTLKMDETEKVFIVPNSSFLKTYGVNYCILTKNNSQSGGLNNKKVYELINYCKNNKIKNYSNINKKDLIKLISKNKSKSIKNKP